MPQPFKIPFKTGGSPFIPSHDRQSVAAEPRGTKRHQACTTVSQAVEPCDPKHGVADRHKSLISTSRPFGPQVSPASSTKDVELQRSVQQSYSVLWRKFTQKKHKTWDGDGLLRISHDQAILYDISGEELGRRRYDLRPVPGSQLVIGTREIEIDACLPGDVASRSLLPSGTRTQSSSMPENNCAPEMKQEKPVFTPLHLEADQDGMSTGFVKSIARLPPDVMAWKRRRIDRGTPLEAPRHDPNVKDALVMPRPKPRNLADVIMDVVVDPLLAKHLRPHQRQGVQFLYECVSGLRDYNGQGAILADEMGLGKTLQVITLLWTLLKQSPYSDQRCVIRKALIICPVTLMYNWRREIQKWLGAERLGVFVYEGNNQRISDFTKGRSYSVMIIGYEKLRGVADDLDINSSVDIVIADEGHRLKSATNKSLLAIQSLNTPRRIILSGTPIQNDLSEFYMMVNLVNPDILGSLKAFLREYEAPIVRSREPQALAADVETGQACTDELANVTEKFILRRTADVIAFLLPPKTEYVLFCKATNAQARIYNDIIASMVPSSLFDAPRMALQLITVLKKVCNSPTLLKHDKGSDMVASTLLTNCRRLTDNQPRHMLSNQASTKLRLLDQLLHTIRTKTKEKVVLVSNYTTTLDLFETLLASLSLSFVRLDGSTPPAKRQALVDLFNSATQTQCFAFILSAKSGGQGLNLTGASRLVLFDVDWNPAIDAQAMARIHRDGQMQPCFIYRFIMAGGIDEKIWQRQVTKLGLAESVLHHAGSSASFSTDELKELFRLIEGDNCQTHDLLGCQCMARASQTQYMADSELCVGSNASMEEIEVGGQESTKWWAGNKFAGNIVNVGPENNAQMSPNVTCMRPLMEYLHVDTRHRSSGAHPRSSDQIKDHVLQDVLQDEDNRVSFIFAKTSK